MESNVMEPVAKRKRHSIGLDAKLKIVEEHENGSSLSELCEKHQLPRTTIMTIVKNKQKIKQIRNRPFDIKRKKYLTQISEDPLERSLIAWVQQKRDIGEPVTGMMLKQQALHLYNKLKSNDPNKKLQFKASEGWLYKFKQRNGLQTPQTKGEKLSADFENGKDFVQAFSQFIEENGYQLEDIYSADEFGLQYKSLPNQTLALPIRREVLSHKPIEERVTIMVCANAAGNHRIPLMVIGKYQHPRCFKNVKRLPVRYEAQPEAWMNCAIFKRWYKDHFIPSVLERKPNGRFLLLLDNAPTHTATDELNEINDKVFIVHLPPNVTSLIQPMKQGVIAATKKYYLREYVSRLLCENRQSHAEAIQFHKRWSLLDFLKVLREAWDMVSESTLANAWKHLIPSHAPNVLTNALATIETQNVTNSAIAELLNKIPGGVTCSCEDVQKWVNQNVQAYKLLSDEELLNRYGNMQLPVPEQSFKENIFREESTKNETNEGEHSAPSVEPLLDAISTLLRGKNKIPKFSRAHMGILLDIHDQLMSLN